VEIYEGVTMRIAQCRRYVVTKKLNRRTRVPRSPHIVFETVENDNLRGFDPRAMNAIRRTYRWYGKAPMLRREELPGAEKGGDYEYLALYSSR